MLRFSFYALLSIGLAVADLHGDFEEGTPNPFWTEFSTQYGSPLCSVSLCGVPFAGFTPYSRTWWAWFGNGNGDEENASLTRQDVFQLGRYLLHFQIIAKYHGTNVASMTDRFYITIDGLRVFEVNATNIGSYGPNSWHFVEVPIVDLADGQLHTIALNSYSSAKSTGNDFADFHIDMIEVVGPPTTGAITSAALTTNPLTTAEVTSGALTTGELTTQAPPLSTGAITSAALTTASGSVAVTTKNLAVTTGVSLTTQPLTTGLPFTTSRVPFTTKPVTTSQITSGRVTSGAITTGLAVTSGALINLNATEDSGTVSGQTGSAAAIGPKFGEFFRLGISTVVMLALAEFWRIRGEIIE